MKVIVTLDIFSGRPNPQIELLDPESTELLRAIAAAPEAISTGPALPILGFRGVVLTLDKATAGRFGLPISFRLGDGTAPDPQASAEFSMRVFHLLSHTLKFELSKFSPRTEPPGWMLPSPNSQAAAGVTATGPLDCSSATTVTDGMHGYYEQSPFTPTFWNSPLTVDRNNCYAYACNMATNDFPQPGGHSDLPDANDLTSVTTNAVADGLERTPRAAETSQGDQPRFKVMLFTIPTTKRHEWDYHWYREHGPEEWGHKPGSHLARNTDNDNKPITDPRLCAKGEYTQDGGYFYVPRTANIASAPPLPKDFRP